MVIKDFKGKTIFLDTAPLIYFIEGHTAYQNTLLKLFTSIDKGEFHFISSTLTLLEVLVKPLKEGHEETVNKYIDLFATSTGIDIFDLNISVAKEAAHLRAKYSVRTPDAIQLATAIVFDADYFLTNDSRLKNVSDIKIALVSDLE